MNIKALATTCGTILIFVGILCIYGWLEKIPSLLQIYPGLVAMVFNTALCFALTGIIILLSNLNTTHNRLLINLISCFILTWGFLSVIENIFNYSLGIDNIFIDSSWLQDTSLNPGRMAINTSFAFILSSIIALALPFGHKKIVAATIQLSTFFIFLVSILGLFLYSLKIEIVTSFYRDNRMAIHTALMFILVSLGWWAIWSRQIWYQEFYKNKEHNKILFITAAIFLTLILMAGLGGLSIITNLLENINLNTTQNLNSQAFTDKINNQMLIILASTIILIIFGFLLLYWQVTPLVKNLALSEFEAKKIKKELLETKERYTLAIQGSNMGLWIWEVGSEVAFYSPQFKNLLGYTDEEFPELIDSFIKILHPDDAPRLAKMVNSHLTDNVPFHIEYRLRVKSGEYRWYQAIGETSKEGETKIMAGSITDITERKMVDKMKNEFIAVVNHEMRTPLTSIKGALGLLLGCSSKYFAGNDKKLLEVAYNNCTRLIRLVNNMLDIEKIEAGKMEFYLKKFNMKILLYEAAKANEEYVNKCNAKLHLECNENIFVMGDYDRLMQVVTNLISNAAKFTRENSEILIKMTHNDQFARVLVKDQGNGIPNEIQHKIFDKFVQAPNQNQKKGSGSGLGLNICKAIIEKHHGAISFISEENKGTTFYFDIPLAKN